MADAAAQKPGSGSRALLWLLILLLLGAVWWLASERNARKYTLASNAGALIISRGHYFPTGTGVIGPGDAQGKLYAGITLPAGTKSMAEVEYEDQNALDRAMYDLLSSSAHALAKKGDAASFADADALAKRLSQLPGLSAEELADLNSLRAELAFWSAGGDVQNAIAQLASARRKLEEVRANGGEHAVMAGPLEDQLEPFGPQLAALAARFAPPAGSAPAPAMVGTPTNSPPSGSAANGAPAGLPIVSLDGGQAFPDAGTMAPPSIASPPGAAPSTNSIVAPPTDAPIRASAPSSVSSGASRGK